MYLVVYDISNEKRLRRIARILQRYGRRVQESVFECDTNGTRCEALREKLKKEKREEDKIFIYHLRINTVREKI